MTYNNSPKTGPSHAGTCGISILSSYVYSVVIRPECLEVIPLVNEESVGLTVRYEVLGTPLSVMEVRVPLPRIDASRDFTSATIGDFNAQLPLGD